MDLLSRFTVSILSEPGVVDPDTEAGDNLLEDLSEAKDFVEEFLIAHLRQRFPTLHATVEVK